MNTTDVSPNSPTDAQTGKQQSILRKIFRVLIFGAILYAALLVMLVFAENSMVFPGSKYPRGNWEPEFSFEEIEFDSSDGTKLVGWLLPRPDATETVLVCHGNAENVAQSSAHLGQTFRSVLNANVFTFDYRGYGKSDGSADEAGVLADAEAALSWLSERTGKPTSEIIVVGHSIGGGPAVHLGSENQLKALVLQRTFASIVEPAQDRYWFVPVSLLMQNRFPSAEKIKKCNSPLFQSHGEIDQIVPIESGRKIYANSPATQKEFFELPDANHWEPYSNEYWSRLRKFVGAIGQQIPADTN